ncbi:MAG: hypothetical protein QM532_01135 [Cyanobium sp. MAG06]|nr:hypothetical protein [Cyanobium sp. MAG06]
MIYNINNINGVTIDVIASTINTSNPAGGLMLLHINKIIYVNNIINGIIDLFFILAL